MAPVQTGGPPGGAAREVERSLVVAASDPERVHEKLKRLRRVGPYALRARGAERIVDRYFDTPDGTLRRRGLALRLRSVDGAMLVGIKGPRKRSSTQTEDRLEHELPYSVRALDELLRRTGLRGGTAGLAGAGDDAEAAVAARLGVRPIQRRETLRLLRDVVDPSAPEGPALAELALDRVSFDLDPVVRHYEVEVEAKRTGRGTRAVTRIADELRSRYPELVDWPYGKLATGRAIERLLARDRLDGLRPDGALTGPSYEQLRRSLARSRIAGE